MSSGVPDGVEDAETLHRLVQPASCGEDKPHYMAFYSSSMPHRISVDRAAYRTIEESITQAPTWGVAALDAGPVRKLPFVPTLAVESVPENDNDAHAEIVVDDLHSKNFVKTKVCKQLADISTIVRSAFK